MHHTKTLLIRFKNPLSVYKIDPFRGAVVKQLQNKDVLFHNHLPNGDGYRYSYPLIQYKRINKKAAILCLGEGTDSIGEFFFDSDLNLNINGEKEKFEIENIQASKNIIQIWDSNFNYRIRKWLALNQKNYERYNEMEGIAEKAQLLENILKGNILSMAKGLNIFFDKQIVCKLKWISEPHIIRYKNTKLTCYDAQFYCNVSIPDFAGLGKGASIGFGTTVRNRDMTKE